MKKLFVLAVMMAAVVCSCSRYELNEDVAEDGSTENYAGEKKFTFTIKGDFMNPEFRDGASRAANDYMVADGVEMTDLWVIDYKDGVIKQELHQSPSDADWGSPVMNLAVGTHHIYFLASRGQGAAYENGIVKWTKPLDTFYLDYAVTVVKTSNGNRSVTLDRVATKMQLVIEDAVPTGTTAITFAPSVWYDGWDMINGVPTEAEGYSATVAIPETMWERSGTSLAVWSPSGKEEWLTDVKVQSMMGSNVDAAVIIKDVPLKANRATIYKGNLYSDNVANGVNLNAQWQTAYEGIF